MVPFNNATESHEHSLETLEILRGYDTFLDSLEKVADFGCGAGLDTKWWATLETRDDPPEPRNYTVYAVDVNPKKITQDVIKLPNVKFCEEDFDTPMDPIVPVPVDFIWCHNVFQYVTNPMSTLANWNSRMNVNGMMILIFPQASRYEYNRYQNTSYNWCYYNHNIVSLMYMLAVNGFDCKDAYFKKEENNPWLYAAVYKSDIPPMNPKNTSWYELAEKNLLNESVEDCLTQYGYVKQEEVVTRWLDKDFYFAKE